MNIDDLITKAQSGNTNAFAELMYSKKEMLYKTAYIYVKNKEDALDIVSETVYRAYKGIKKLKNPEFFNTYVTRILINCSIDMLKKKNKFVLDSESVLQSEASKDEGIEENIDLYRAVDMLNDKYKTVIILKYFRDMTFEDISETMQCPIGTVKTYLHRALKVLRMDLIEE
ncbi:sigma-70 family RNA polymerase sigma factor [Clostridium hydrogenum]|uniref:sigma-70 family RNA polymerase sigma factor n=1 Tax=Clostridium hydrogenum TaxID=2855764 RepID=UPI001F3E719D|nr:sigma-70 family RNA polymerase sigma factor [Clostridium hydrogenum]